MGAFAEVLACRGVGLSVLRLGGGKDVDALTLGGLTPFTEATLARTESDFKQACAIDSITKRHADEKASGVAHILSPTARSEGLSVCRTERCLQPNPVATSELLTPDFWN
jgi:hypothetical protein